MIFQCVSPWKRAHKRQPTRSRAWTTLWLVLHEAWLVVNKQPFMGKLCTFVENPSLLSVTLRNAFPTSPLAPRTEKDPHMTRTGAVGGKMCLPTLT